MDEPSREERVAELAARLQGLPPGEVQRMVLVVLVQTVVSLALQALLFGIGVRTAGRLYRDRHLDRRRPRLIAASKPLLVVSALDVLGLALTTLWLARWLRRVNAATRG